MKGRRIKTLCELAALAKERRSVVSTLPGSTVHRPQPAAWVMNMQAVWVNDMIERGLYLYDSPKASHRRWLRNEKEEE